MSREGLWVAPLLSRKRASAAARSTPSLSKRPGSQRHAFKRPDADEQNPRGA